MAFLPTITELVKRKLDHLIADTDGTIEDIPKGKHLTNSTAIQNRSTFENLCSEILLEIFIYLRPIDLLYSFMGLNSQLDGLIEPYTHTLDFRLISKSYFQCLMESLLPYSTNKLRVLRLSNESTFSQISDILFNFDWSLINQLESLTFDSIRFDELSKYLLNIHPLLKHLWRLSVTLDENNKSVDKLLLDRIFIPINQSIINCSIAGVTFDISPLARLPPNKNLRELTITLATINDLIILFNFLPQLEFLTCTIEKKLLNMSHISKIQSINHLTMLTLNIKEPIIFENFQKILIPHINLKRLSLQARFCDEVKSKHEIGGLALEKLFRSFSQLTELHFYFRHHQTPVDVPISNELYLFSFTSHFWIDRSIEVSTYITNAHERHIYTLPFHFDTFYITGDFVDFSQTRSSSHHFTNIRHLIISPMVILDEYNYSSLTLIFELFPKIKTVKSMENQSLSNETKHTLEENHWTLQKFGSSSKTVSCTYIRNSRKGTHQYYRTLDITDGDQRYFANKSKCVRQLTIYNMTEDQTIPLIYFFPWIDVLILYFESTTWINLPSEWLFNLLMNMNSLFSLTIHYSVDVEEKNIRDLLANTLVSLKKHFFIKYHHGIVNIWF